jgi:hypothetical protein
VVLLLLAACGGRSPEPPADGEGVAALDQAETQTTPPKDEGNAGKEKDAGGAKGKPPTGKGNGANRSDDANGSGAGDGNNAPADQGSDGSSANSDSSGAAQATPAVPIPAGTHSYDTDGSATVSGSRRPMPKTTTLGAKAPRKGQQVQIRDLRDSEGNGTVVESHLVYIEEGVYLTYVKITATFPGGFTDVRELQPSKPALIAPTGAGPGTTASFTMQGSGTRADVDIAAKSTQKVSIGGTSVNTLVVDTKIEFSGAYEGEQLSTSWFWGKHVLALKEHVRTDVTNGPIRVQSEYEATLTRLP